MVLTTMNRLLWIQGWGGVGWKDAELEDLDPMGPKDDIPNT